MPRGPRLDAPGVLHHVMVRGIEDKLIFQDDTDRSKFLKRLAELVPRFGLRIYAWALLPNHIHVLLRTGTSPLSRAMRALLTGYAGDFNRRHKRRGHLFQNRYKSIVVEEETYFLELVRYIHLNPLRAHVVSRLEALDVFPWAGHSCLLGRHPRAWQASDEVLARFATRLAAARTRYSAFLKAGMSSGRRPELQGGGLIRSAGGWAAVQALRRGREAYVSDERILGSSEFVQALLKQVELEHGGPRPAPELEGLVGAVCRHLGLPIPAVRGKGRRDLVARAREGIAYLWLDVYGQSGRELAERLGVKSPAVYKAARRGREVSKEWLGLRTEG